MQCITTTIPSKFIVFKDALQLLLTPTTHHGFHKPTYCYDVQVGKNYFLKRDIPPEERSTAVTASLNIR